jgi:UPF0755 protein
MPGHRPRRGCTCLAFLATSMVCGLLAGAALIGLTLPAVSTTLGDADPSLDPVQRGLLVAYLTVRHAALDQPAGGSAEQVEVEVLPGESASGVLGRLRDMDIVRDPLLVRAYLRYLGVDRAIQAGLYRLSGSMSPREMAQALQHASAPAIVLTIPEGWRLEQIAEVLPAAGAPFAPQAFLDAARSGTAVSPLLPELPLATNLEGFLFPDTYHLTGDSQPLDLVATMLETFDQRVTPELRAGFATQGLSLYQAVTLASIVEREAAVADERPLIASVFLNRVAQGVKLDADPTVQYALGQQPDGSWWKAGLTLDDLQVDSPYNTYVRTGLPPSPIANPGLESLRAVAFPADSPYLYFRTACDGSGRHTFAETLDQQLLNACP